VQVERGTITTEEYDKEMEAIEGVAGAMKEIRTALTSPEASGVAIAFSELLSRPGTQKPESLWA
jgi:hypothetical protein